MPEPPITDGQLRYVRHQLNVLSSSVSYQAQKELLEAVEWFVAERREREQESRTLVPLERPLSHLGPVIDRLTGDASIPDSSRIILTTFLQAVDRTNDAIRDLIQRHVETTDPEIRLRAVTRLAMATGWAASMPHEERDRGSPE